MTYRKKEKKMLKSKMQKIKRQKGENSNKKDHRLGSTLNFTPPPQFYGF